MSETALLVTKPGQVTAKDRAALRKAGVVVIEVDDPATVRFIKPNAELSSTEMLLAAMRAINRVGKWGHEYLGQEIASALLATSPAVSAPEQLETAE